METLVVIGKILIGLFGLGIMIFVHELGHLVAAKLLRVKVETFSLGYGKKLFGFRKGGTMYQVAMFPVGGFCKMKGEHLFTQAIEQNLDRIPDDPESYYNTPPWKRILISLAGPLFNVLFALLLFTMLYWIGFNEYTYDNKVLLTSDMAITRPLRDPSPAETAGLRSGDRITSINGKPIRHFTDLLHAIYPAPNQELQLTYEREGIAHKVSIVPLLDTEYAHGYIGVTYAAEPIIDRISTEMAALNPWLQTGDRIIRLNELPVHNQLDIMNAFRDKTKVPAVIVRNDTQIRRDLYMNLSFDSASGFPAFGLTFMDKPFRTPAMNFFQAFGRSAEEIGSTVSSIVGFFALIPQQINVGNAISGPIRTTYLIGEVAGQGLEKGLDQGIVQFLQFLGTLSVILFFMNLLPLPILDGGFVVLFFIELLRRKPFRPRFLFRFQMIGVGLLALLIVFIVINDITKFFV